MLPLPRVPREWTAAWRMTQTLSNSASAPSTEMPVLMEMRSRASVRFFTSLASARLAASKRAASIPSVPEWSSASPIDDYYDYVGHLMALGDEASLDASEVLGRQLLLGLVSGVEQHFRSTITKVLRSGRAGPRGPWVLRLLSPRLSFDNVRLRSSIFVLR